MADENQRYQAAGAPTMKKQTVAIFSVSAGASHARAAEALKTYDGAGLAYKAEMLLNNPKQLA